MALQIKGKFIQSEAIDGSKLKLKQGESLRATDANGVDIELLKIGPNGEIIANGDELALDASLDAEVARASAAESGLSDDIAAEAASRSAADSSLQANIDAEAAARAAAVSAEASARAAAVSAEASARESADSTLQSNIDAEAAARASAVSAEAASRASADSALSARLDVVEGSGVGSIAKAELDAKAYADQKISELVDSAPAVLDTLKELSDALGGDENFATTVANNIGTVQSNLDAEEARALAAEQALQAAITAEEAARSAAVSAEQTRAEGAEASLSAAISSEANARVAAVSAEASARSAADSALQDAIDAEEARALAAEAALQASVTALEQSVGQSLADQVDALEAAAAAEEAARIAADSALQSELDAEEARAAAAEAALAQDIADEEAARIAAVSAEEAARIAAVSAEAASRSSADSALQASIDAEVSARASAVSSEASARAAADSTLQGNIDSEEAARIAGDAATLASANSYTDAQVAALVDSAPAVLDTLKELSDALGGDENFATTIANQVGTVQSNLDAEEARALAAEAALSAAISAEESARVVAVSAEESRALAAEALKVNKAGDTITGEMVFDNADLKVKNPSGQVVAHFDASESSAIFGYASPDTLSTELVGGAIKVEAGVNLGGAQTFVGAGFINLQESDGSAAMPTVAKHAASKAYVDQEVSAEAAARASVDTAHNSRIAALEAKAFYKYEKQLTATDIANGYLTLPHLIESKSSMVAVGRLLAHEGAAYDYVVSTVGSVSRITFQNSLLAGGEEALAVGDYVFVQYRA